MKLLVATTNRGKLNEFKEILKDYFEEILSYNEIGQVIDIEETGSTFQQNAKKKAIEAAKATGYITLADDSGLVVDALNGLPGVYSARYSKQGDDASNNAKLLTKMLGVPNERRTARFVCALCLCNPENLNTINVTGSCEGYITEKPVGNDGFGYDPCFYYPDAKMTFGQMTDEEKNQVSHRRNAIEELKRVLELRKQSEEGIWKED